MTAEPTGWRSFFADWPACEVCGERCKRGAVGDRGPFAYAGDGVSDRCISLLAERRFARDGLATWLDGQGMAYERFEDLFDVAGALAGGTERLTVVAARVYPAPTHERRG